MLISILSLQRRFFASIRALWAADAADLRSLFAVLDATYNEPRRAYHSWYHIVDTLSLLDKYQQNGARDAGLGRVVSMARRCSATSTLLSWDRLRSAIWATSGRCERNTATSQMTPFIRDACESWGTSSPFGGSTRLRTSLPASLLWPVVTSLTSLRLSNRTRFELAALFRILTAWTIATQPS